MPQVTIDVPEEYGALYEDQWRYVIYYGGRYSLKSYNVALSQLIRGRQRKMRFLDTREVQNSIKDSVHKLLADQIARYGFDDYIVMNETIRNKITGSEWIFKGLKHNIAEIKSMEGIDEAWCFAADTIVSGRRIQDIKVGDYVESFNHTTGTVERQRVLAIMKRPMPAKMFRVLTHYGSNSTIVTGEHPYYVKGKGYTKVTNLNVGDIVYASENRNARISTVLRRLWRNDSDRHKKPSSKVQQKWRLILLGLCKTDSFGENAKEESNVRHKSKRANDQKAKRVQAPTTSLRWKWQRLHQAANAAIREARQGLVERISSDSGRKQESARQPNSLQSRLSKHLLQTRNRMRRQQTRRGRIKTQRYTEKRVLKEYRVDGIEIQKQGDIRKDGLSDGGNYVYNIEVEVNNNYFADGILVHNCEEGQAMTAQSLDILTPTIRKAGSRIVVTFNRLTELDPVYEKFVMNPPDKTYSMQLNYDIAERYGLMTDEIREEIDHDKKTDLVLYNHKWLGQPLSQTDKAIINRDQIIEAMSREIEDDGAIEVGVDVARYGSDRSEFVMRKGLAEKKRETHTKLSLTELGDRLEAFVNQDKGILIKIDDTGVGGGLTDIMISRGYNVMAINFGSNPSDRDKYPNLISEAWFYMQEIMPTISLKHDRDLLMELSTREWVMDSRGRRGVESKDTYKKKGYRSPDKADATILAYYTPVVKPLEYGGVR